MDFSIPPPFPVSMPAPTSDAHMENDSSTADHQKAEDEASILSTDGQLNSGGDLADLSDESDNLPDSEKLALALSCRDEGNRKLKEGDVIGAVEMYENGVSNIKKVFGLEGHELEKSVKEAKLALNLNLSLCRIKQQEWIKAIRAASSALEIEPDNVKGLFRRGVARGSIGWLEESKADLMRVCQLDPSNVEARRELVRIKQKMDEAKTRDIQAFKGLFAKTAGMYDDREKQMKEEKVKQEEKVKREMKEYEAENKDREARGEEPIRSFEKWQKEKEQEKIKKEEKKRFSGATAGGCCTSGSTVAKSSQDFLDDEDKKILDETKKMGYCYFNRKIDEEEKARLQQTNNPMKIDTSIESETDGQSKKALSSWNREGTTYEEKDCSSWAREALFQRLKSINFRTSTADDLVEEATKCISEVRLNQSNYSEEDRFQLLVDLVPTTLVITAVTPVEGDAHVLVVRASKRYLYDFKFDISWSLDVSLSLLDDGSFPSDTESAFSATTYTGLVAFHDVSSASGSRSTNEDTGVDWLKDASSRINPPLPASRLHRLVVSKAIESIKAEVFQSVRLFENDFKSFT